MTGLNKLIHMRSFWTSLFSVTGIVLHELFGADIINQDTETIFVAAILALFGANGAVDAIETAKSNG